MRLMTFVVHIGAGSLALIAGYIALFATKGAWLHRKSGMVFVYAMLTMCTAGFSLAVGLNSGPAVNVPAALLTAYLVVTSLTTVRPLATAARPVHVVAMLVVIGVAAADLLFASQAIANGGRREGIPTFPFVLFAVLGLLGALGDVRVLRSGPLQGSPRLARHLWRMSSALAIAAMSFFLGQAKVLPKSIRIPGLLMLPILAVLLTMFYWLWRVRARRRARGLVRVSAPEAV
jgi:hypothetical protein